jgi:hypothetical protein
MKKFPLIGFTGFLLVLASCNRPRPERSYEVVVDTTAFRTSLFGSDGSDLRVSRP